MIRDLNHACPKKMINDVANWFGKPELIKLSCGKPVSRAFGQHIFLLVVFSANALIYK